jgi:cytoskeletal protein CcmA (bactofilin family)
MFDIGKKGSDKSQDSGSRDDRHGGAGAAGSDAAAGKRSASSSREAAVIGPSIHIDGDLRGEEDLLIEGEVNGTVQLKNNSLTIGSKGKIRADVYAHSIHVEGFVEGDLYGSERVNIRKNAQVRGNITSPRVSLEDGARFKGSIEMDPQAVDAALGTRRGAAGSSHAGSTDAAKQGAAFKPGDVAGGNKPEATAGVKRG